MLKLERGGVFPKKVKGNKLNMEITTPLLQAFCKYLQGEERAQATIEKYLHDVRALRAWLGERMLCKEEMLSYKKYLCNRYAPASVNTMLASLHCFFRFAGWQDLQVKKIKIQSQHFISMEKELTHAEYERLLQAAAKRKNVRLGLVIQCICATGIRVSELQYITIAAVRCGVAEICCKGKHRRVFLPPQLCKMLMQYCKQQKRTSGAVFVTKNGNPLDRSNIWGEMKGLCKVAQVSAQKVFPHNLRHLFARTYYSKQKDIVRLADILGHSNVNTTRIYTMEGGEIHRRQIGRLGLLRC